MLRVPSLVPPHVLLNPPGVQRISGTGCILMLWSRPRLRSPPTFHGRSTSPAASRPSGRHRGRPAVRIAAPVALEAEEYRRWGSATAGPGAKRCGSHDRCRRRPSRHITSPPGLEPVPARRAISRAGGDGTRETSAFSRFLLFSCLPRGIPSPDAVEIEEFRSGGATDITFT